GICILIDDIDLAEECIPESIVGFSAGHRKQKVSEFSECTVRIRDAHSVLAAAFLVFDAGIDLRQQFPAKRRWITAMTRFGAKVGGSTVRDVELINLGAPSVRVPGIRIDLFHLDDLAKVDQEPPTFSTRVEKEIGTGFVLFGGQFAVMQYVE